MIIFPDNKASRTLGKTFALAGQNIVVVTGDLRDPEFLVSLAHELGHQRKNAEIGNRSVLYDPSLINNNEAAKILKSERDASAFALSILRPFIDSGSNKRLLNRTQTIKNLESCIASYSNRLFWMQAMNRYLPKSEDKSPEQKNNIREKYYLSIPELIQNADGFITSINERPEWVADELKEFCEFIVGKVDDIAFDQAHILKVDIRNLDTAEGRLRVFCFKVLDEIETKSPQINQQGSIERIDKIKTMVSTLENRDDEVKF